MSLKKIVARVLGVVGPALLAWGRTEAEKALAAVKNSPTGSRITELVRDAEDTGKSGPEKLAAVLADAAPLVLALVTKGGLKAELSAVETLTRSVIESIVADAKAIPLARAILVALGLKSSA